MTDSPHDTPAYGKLKKAGILVLLCLAVPPLLIGSAIVAPAMRWWYRSIGIES